MNKISIFLLALLFTAKANSQTSALTVTKGLETSSYVNMVFTLTVNPAIPFFSCNVQVAHGDLSEPTQVAVTTPSPDYTTNITNNGGLVLNCVVDDIPKAVPVGPISWTIRFKKGNTATVNFALPTGGLNECLDVVAQNYPAIIKQPSVEVEIIPNKIAIKPYPNPTRDLVSVQKFKAFKTMNIYNLQGVLLLKSNKVEADVSAFSAGAYILEVEDTEGDKSRVKFVKE